jgi:hypothetical protein
LRQLADWGQRHGIWIIFELHAAPGGQNTYFHSGGGNRLWDDDEAQARFYALWEKIAEALKGHPGVGAFDLLNEPTPTPFDDPEQATQKLRRIYREATRRIRRVDPHRLVIWANINRWSLWYDPQRPGGFVRSDSPGVAYTFHFYQPGKFTHPRPGRKPITYPGRINGRPFHRGLLDELLRPFVRFARQVEAPLWVGEFGVSRNVPGTSDAAWAADLIDLFESYGFSWSYYRYKNMRWQGPFPLFTLRPEALKRLVAIREAVERYSRGEPDGLDPKTLTAQDAAAFHIDQPVWQVDEPLFEAIRARLARD